MRMCTKSASKNEKKCGAHKQQGHRRVPRQPCPPAAVPAPASTVAAAPGGTLVPTVSVLLLPGTARLLNMMYISPKLAVDVDGMRTALGLPVTSCRQSKNVWTSYSGKGYGGVYDAALYG